MTTGKTIALTRWTLVGKVMPLLFNMLSSWVIIFLPRSKRLFVVVVLMKRGPLEKGMANHFSIPALRTP